MPVESRPVENWPVENWIVDDIDELIAFRHDLHRHPELLYELPRTAERVRVALLAAGVDKVVPGVGGTGVVGVIRGHRDTHGRAIGLRADMDALPIHEEGTMAWASTIPGRMHACGHDGHTSMLLGAARELVRSRAFDGTVVVIFQPAEEGGAGAQAMIDDGLFERFPMDEIYGMHNRPGVPLGQFAIRPGAMLAAADEVRIDVVGRGGHAAAPQRTIDPLAVSAALLQAIQGIVARSVDPLDAAVISLTSIHGGEAFNVVPGKVSLLGTARTLRAETRDLLERRLGEVADGIARAFEADVSLDYGRRYPVTVNHERETAHAVRAATGIAGAAHVDTDYAPSLGGEDFAFMLQHRPGAMIFLGNGDSAGLHHPAYDFDDEAIAWGCSYWSTLARQRLPLDR